MHAGGLPLSVMSVRMDSRLRGNDHVCGNDEGGMSRED